MLIVININITIDTIINNGSVMQELVLYRWYWCL